MPITLFALKNCEKIKDTLTLKKVYADMKKQERQAWSNTNKALHEQGAEPIFTPKHYKELRELDKGA